MLRLKTLQVQGINCKSGRLYRHGPDLQRRQNTFYRTTLGSKWRTGLWGGCVMAKWVLGDGSGGGGWWGPVGLALDWHPAWRCPHLCSVWQLQQEFPLWNDTKFSTTFCLLSLLLATLLPWFFKCYMSLQDRNAIICPHLIRAVLVPILWSISYMTSVDIRARRNMC